ncbi:copper chaperone PCu(A)C [Candidatus Thioglobus autotrophicus]|uniref:copper chaperone PCu(A)C n=1 Tax=Candidatus Thioglobus autotrophicus TaxID=1705394 RepID=UPI00299E14AB|nr:copper chaperone PCu(A)C [Candidatus Thioglobus autotrophicus]WPE16924.1 copper chaperone PCu(A)C [Candidatus Thioglobus autotrophicus]WPE18477.1 copper chaperone PCu(A)C [Candidatus Thioglobus autotrophicus]
MLNNIKKILFILVAFVSITATNAASHAHQNNHVNHQITITDPWIRSAPINAPALGLFMNISNNTNQEVRLISAHTKGYKRIELHRTIDSHGVMKMVKQAFMPIPAHAKLHLKPGSWHIMLIAPEQVPSEGEQVSVSLKFNDGSTQTIQVLVRKGGMMMQHHSMH